MFITCASQGFETIPRNNPWSTVHRDLQGKVVTTDLHNFDLFCLPSPPSLTGAVRQSDCNQTLLVGAGLQDCRWGLAELERLLQLLQLGSTLLINCRLILILFDQTRLKHCSAVPVLIALNNNIKLGIQQASWDSSKQFYKADWCATKYFNLLFAALAATLQITNLHNNG